MTNKETKSSLSFSKLQTNHQNANQSRLQKWNIKMCFNRLLIMTIIILGKMSDMNFE